MTDQLDISVAPARLYRDPASAINLWRADGQWTLRGIERRLPLLRKELLAAASADAAWDISRIELLDSVGALLLVEAWGDQLPQSLQAQPNHRALLQDFLSDKLKQDRSVTSAQAFFNLLAVAEELARISRKLAAFIALIGQFTLDLALLVRHPRRMPWREFSATFYKTGTLALPITGLVGLLVGVVLSYLSALQLRLLGAEVYIVNLLGLGIVRELGPLMAAILVAGRSGSAITAEIGVMRINEELDALWVMNIPPALRLILPKVLALAVALPFITLWTNAMAIFGGMLVADFELNINMRQFLVALPDAIPIGTYWLSTGKSVVFGLAIGLIACHYGLRVLPNTSSLGRETTNSVVIAITMVILINALFAIAFREVGWYD